MLSPADIELAARDRQLPSLATVLDPDGLRELVCRAAPAAPLRAVQVRYVRYKPGTSCLLSCQLDLAGAPTEAYVKLYRRDALDKLRKAAGRPAAPGPLGAGRVVLDELGLVLATFPNDSHLKPLLRLADRRRRKRWFAQLLPERPMFRKATWLPLRYKPERRFVGLLTTRLGEKAVVKVYAPGQFRQPWSNAQAIRSRGALVVPELLGAVPRRHTLAFAWQQGRSLRDACASPTFDAEQLVEVGAALAELHAQTDPDLRPISQVGAARRLHLSAESLGLLCPRLYGRATALAQRLAAALLDSPPEFGTLHGDFSAGQVLLTDHGIAILDLDEAAYGDPLADLGNFAANLHRDALRGRLGAENIDGWMAALVDGYRAAISRGLLERIDLHTSASLLHLAVQPFRLRETDWDDHAAALLEQAERIAAGVRSPAVAPLARPAPQVPVSDPGAAVRDPALGFLRQALEPAVAEQELQACCGGLLGIDGRLQLRAIRVVRHKPGRRCLVEYVVQIERNDATLDVVTLLGKARAKGVDTYSYHWQASLWNAGFGGDAEDGIAVPEPVAIVPAFQMWLQRRAPGLPVGRLWRGPYGAVLPRRIAEAIWKLQTLGIDTSHRHTLADELRILGERLEPLADARPEWSRRLTRLLAACRDLGAALPEAPLVPCHRDFYPDQVVADGDRLYLVDLDLYCLGDPGLDAGNFLAHLTDTALREQQHPAGLQDVQAAILDRLAELAGPHIRRRVRTYAALSLARLVAISTQFPERSPYTEQLLALCECELGLAGPAADGPGAARPHPPPLQPAELDYH